ncbi:MAG: sulfite exporter TauE/SafE family protein [Nitrospirae bacterium]|nr:sulfite exporter TauE/SafE family protein [Nitrospirota bacterium]
MLALIALMICTTVCTLAMEASVLFVPAFLYLFPILIPSFPRITPNEAIGLAITIEFFGYTSSVSGYWFRRQIDFAIAGKVLAFTVPLAMLSRAVSYFLPARGLLLVFGFLLIALAGILLRTAHHPREALTEYRPRTALLPSSGSPADSRFHLRGFDWPIVLSAGALAGLVGIAIGEISNTFLTVRKQIPIKISTGTSALILHATLLSALGMNLAILNLAPQFFQAEQIAIPWRVAVIFIPVLLIGGQIGAFLNSRLTEQTILTALVTVYLAVGVFMSVGQ